MTIVYTFDRSITAAELAPLLRQASWATTRPDERLQIMIDNSVNLTVWQDDRLVGYARVITDDCYRAFIEDVIVDESLRGQGIGRGLIQAIIERFSHIEEMCLACSDENVPFYEQYGFSRTGNNHLHIWNGSA